MIQVVPDIDKETIEKILSFLPEPTSITVNLFGGSEAIDLSNELLNKYVHLGLKLSHASTPDAIINIPTKEKLMKIMFPLNFSYEFPRIGLQYAQFHMEGVQILLDAYSVKIYYSIGEGTKNMLKLLEGIADFKNIYNIEVHKY